jgi:hypothetical protein
MAFFLCSVYAEWDFSSAEPTRNGIQSNLSQDSVKKLKTLGKYALQSERNRILNNGTKNIFRCKKKTKEQKYFKLVTF